MGMRLQEELLERFCSYTLGFAFPSQGIDNEEGEDNSSTAIGSYIARGHIVLLIVQLVETGLYMDNVCQTVRPV